jgi:hypothetical protein
MKKLLAVLLFVTNQLYSQDTVFFKVEPQKPHVVSSARIKDGLLYVKAPNSDVETKIDTSMVSRIVFNQFNFKFSKIIIDSTTNKITFLTIERVDSMSRKNLYTNAKIWFTNTFKSAKHVIQLDDPETGIIIGKGFGSIPVSNGLLNVPLDMYFTIKIQVKEGRYKFEVTDIYYHYKASQYAGAYDQYAEEVITDEQVFKKNGEERPVKASYRNSTIAEVNSLFKSLDKQMSLQILSKDDW